MKNCAISATFAIVAFGMSPANAQSEPANPQSEDKPEVLWMGIYEGMSNDEALTQILKIPGVEGVKIAKKPKPVRSKDYNRYLPSGTVEALIIDQHENPKKMVTILDYPARFSVLSSPEGRVVSVIVTPLIRETSGASGGGCVGYTDQTFENGKSVWRTALTRKYPTTLPVTGDSATFTNEKVAVTMLTTFRGADRRLTDLEKLQRRQANPFLIDLSEITGCFVNTYNVNLIYNSSRALGEVMNEKSAQADSNL